jgi:trans-aconitate methyltransferase
MYKWDVMDYSRSSSEQQRWARELLEKLKLKGDEHVLDIGSGDGKVTAEIAGLLVHGSIVGIDSSEDMVRFAKDNFPEDKFNNLSFEIMDARKLSFDADFDVVFSNATLHWVIDHKPVLTGIRRSLKPQGRILLQMGGKGNVEEVLKVMEGVIKREKWRKYFTSFTFPYGFYGPREYSSWLREAGLDAKRVELIEKDMVHKEKDGFAAWIRTTWLPYTQRVPEWQRSQFVEDVADAYLVLRPIDDKGFVHIKMIRLEVEAIRGREA